MEPSVSFLAQKAWPQRAALKARVHWDGFWASPLEYLQASWWRIRGKRLRSRHVIASLIGRSPQAYDLWQLSKGRARREPGPVAEIFAVVDGRRASEGLAETLASVGAAGLNPVLLGKPPTGFREQVIGSPGELARLAPTSGSLLLIALQPGDLVSHDVRERYSEVLEPEDRILYADDDLIDPAGRRREPHFKPRWNGELFRHHDYISGASLVRAGRQELAQLPETGWVEALTATALDAGARPKHVPAILHHRRRRPDPQLPPRAIAVSSSDCPPVSVIIPTRNKAPLLRACVEGLRKTDYPEIELIIVDNGSDEAEALALLAELKARGAQVLPIPGAFNFSRLNNEAAKLATGKLLCLLNNDIEVLATDWLQIMAMQAIRDDVGAVGARLLYPDQTIQHAGVVVGLGGGAGHAHRYEALDDAGYFRRTHLPQFVSAVTAACLVVERDRFWAVGGLDEQRFPVAFNDVDLCLRLNARGWQSFYEPRATLIHHESKSRGKDSHPANRDRFARELAHLKERWNTEAAQDPFHHPSLSRFSERFVIDL